MQTAFPGMAALAIVVAGSLPAGTHHSHPIFYDLCTSLTIEGEIESVQWDGKPYRPDARAEPASWELDIWVIG